MDGGKCSNGSTNGQFWTDIEEIDRQVARLDNGECAPRDIHLTIRTGVEDVHALEERLLDFAIALLDVPPRGGTGTGPTGKVGDQFLEGYRNSGKIPSHVHQQNFDDRRDEILMESLSAAWLGLYFLGIPFVHPWEKVRRLIDERGGIPSGACMAKFIGDTYRGARLYRGGAGAAGGSAKPLLVLSYTPLPLLQGMLLYEERSHLTPAVVHRLALRYTLLQLRLYVRQGSPIHMFVPANALRAAVEKLARMADYGRSATPESLEQIRLGIENGMWDWFRTVFPQPVRAALPVNQSVKLLRDQEQTAGMPTCVLGNRQGVYTMETGNSGLHFAGNHIGGQLLRSYRRKLETLAGKPEVAEDLVPMGEADFRQAVSRVLRRVTDDKRRAGTSVLAQPVDTNAGRVHP